MSAVPARTVERAPRSTAFVVALGVGGLALRLRVLPMGDGVRTILLIAILSAILVASLLVPVPRGRARMGVRSTLGIGLAGVAIAAVAGGRPIAAPLGATALALSLLAAVAEEALFRRALYGWLERSGPLIAVLGSALLFALIHVPLYGAAAFPVDLGAGLLLSWQRWASGTWTVAAATHAGANLLAVVMR